ncbi:hypothetical protein [Rossellomorea marisflavi]|jgi:hypothetical protein|uniref:hypothetical protein n=1 Tax=Rossellomorea marisflavi TaxID=189381 RepID=UPI00114E7E00|nr:hypothetical protein [Rossellomorea marisflavi]UKS66025.1 hypothetical protein K6T23_03910 [Rossellomorea marisflavi]
MTINHGGDLSEGYFIAYLTLIMNSRGSTLEEAKAFTFKRLFQNDEGTLGDYSYRRFIQAYQHLEQEGSCA